MEPRAKADSPNPIATLDPGHTVNRLSASARLDILRRLRLDGPGFNDTFDAFARLIGELLGAPTALVSIIEGDRQVFLGHRGLDGALAERGEIPRKHSFCHLMLDAGEPLTIRDAREDEDARRTEAVRELGVVAYAGCPLVLADGTVVGAVCAIDRRPRSWSEREVSLLGELAAAVGGMLELRAELVHRELHDRLTGLPNRELLVSSCEEMLRDSSGSGRVTVICAGINHFNLINQAFGTANADLVLRAVALRLLAVARQSDVFGRLRGDVFTLISARPESEAEALALAEEIHATLAEPLEVSGERLSVNATIGIATGGLESGRGDLISQAANAMRVAKRQQGRSRIAEKGWTEAAARQLRMREALHGAVERDEVSVAFQPVVELKSGDVVAFEALARWTHPELGPVSPVDFIPLAELTADIVPIGDFVLERSAELARRLRARFGEMRVGVNVSPVQLERSDFAEAFAATLDRAGVGGDAVGIEITEGTLLETGTAQASNLRRLRDRNVHIVLDDFGTGYSGLGYLRELPIETVKIDRSFVRDLAHDRTSTALVQAILAMAEGLELNVVAEGIESAEQSRLLRRLGCAYGQGFGLGMPVPADEALASVDR